MLQSRSFLTVSLPVNWDMEVSRYSWTSAFLCPNSAVCRSAGGCALALSAQAWCEGPDPLREMVGWLSSALLDPSPWAGATKPPAPKRSAAAVVCSNSPFTATHMARASGDLDANGVEGEVVNLSTHHSFRKSHTCDYTLHCFISIFYPFYCS